MGGLVGNLPCHAVLTTSRANGHGIQWAVCRVVPKLGLPSCDVCDARVLDDVGAARFVPVCALRSSPQEVDQQLKPEGPVEAAI